MKIADIEDHYPLSPMQQGMLFHSLYKPWSGFYIQQQVCVVSEELCLEAFQRAWRRLIERHSILRTGFRLDSAEQEVHRSVGLPLRQEDWRGLSEDERSNRLENYLEAERRQGFSLDDVPLMRITLCRLSEAEYQFIWTYHHALLDGRSRLLLLKELFTIYEAFSHGREVELPDSIPYRSYVDWLQQQDLSEAEHFWRGLLSGFTAPTSLVVNELIEPKDRGSGNNSLQLSAELTVALQSFANQHQLTLNALLLGAWALLLSRYSGEADVVFGVTRACRRSQSKSHSRAGLFINTLPMRVRIQDGALVVSWLKELRRAWTKQSRYDHTSLEKIQSWSEVPAGTPLFQSLVVFEKSLVESRLRSLGANWERRRFQLHQRSHYPLVLAGYEEPEFLIHLEYDRRSFDEPTISRLLGHIRQILESMIAKPHGRIFELSLLTKTEKHQLLYEWPVTKSGSSCPEAFIQQLFEGQVEQTPEAVAATFADRQLSYRELNQRANQLARHLQAFKIGPESLVGILLEPSLDSLVAILSVFKAGAAYVPLDPRFPRERLKFMIEDARPQLLLTAEKFKDVLGTQELRIVCLDAVWEQIAGQSDANPPCKLAAENLAYVIYTSGSTGQPKGVAISHGAIARHCLTVQKHYELTPLDKVLNFSSLSFDASVEQMLPPLITGAGLVLRGKEVWGVREFQSEVLRSGVTVINLPSPYWHELVRDWKTSGQGPGKLKLAVIGSDVVNPESVFLWQASSLRSVRLINAYGPTETTITATTFKVPPQYLEQKRRNVPIGRPLANRTAYILDHDYQPVPIGVDGELYLGGACLARGYLNRPGYTAERFIPDPFSDQPGERLYKTGDLARWLPDGNLEFIGRLDHQVKIRGYRIELGEIEAALVEHQAVSASVVNAWQESLGEKRLVAYFVANRRPPPNVSELRSFLLERLPEYMVPSAFVLMETLPLTPTGKIDRRALPQPESTRPALEKAYVAPHSQIELALTEIFASVLELERVGVDDNFFELGGHSLLAMQVASRIRASLKVDLPLRSLFENPTVARLALRINQDLRAQERQSPKPNIPIPRVGKFPLSFAQQRLWFLNQLEPNTAAYNIPLALRLYGRLNKQALCQALQELVTRHESLRTSFKVVDGVPVQVITPILSVTLPERDLSELSEGERETEAQRLTLVEARCHFDLALGPLLNCSLLRLQEQEYLLLLTIHHIVADGWSMHILYKELAVLYEAFCAGRSSPLAKLPIHYADFAVWQRQWLKGKVLATQLAYWKQQLHGVPTLLELPTDRPRHAIRTFAGARHSIVLPQNLVDGLRAFSRREEVTLFMTLLAAFNTLLFRYTGQEDIVVGSLTAGRNYVELEPLIGLFVNTLALRSDLSGNPSFRQLVARVRSVTLDAYAHQELPFDKLVEELEPQRNLSHSPLFQVMFAFQNTPKRAPELSGLTVKPVDVSTGTAKFDLTLTVHDKEGRLRVLLEYNTGLFEVETIKRLLRHFQTLLEAILSDPDRRISDLPLLTRAERQQLLIEWNKTATAYPRDSCIHELFEEQVSRTPDAVAVVSENQRLTYRELNERANQLAHYLQDLGVGPEVPVGILMERSQEMVVGIMGILKAGGAYVPLDPGYPQERLAYISEDAQLKVLLTQEGIKANFAEHKVCLDRDWKQIATKSGENPVSQVKADNLIYSIYTSGSTGRPKGVMLNHRSVVNCMCWLQATHQLNEVDRIFFKASLSFDGSCLELFWPLMVGANLVIVRDGEQRDTSYLLRSTIKHGITTLYFVPSMFQEFLCEPGVEFARSVKRVICGGEALSAETAQRCNRRLAAELHNFYGPTESAIGSLNWLCERGRSWSITPIGRPGSNTKVYVLGNHLEPVPVGVVGELHITGDGLARGYLNRPDLTAEKFIPNPFSDEPGGRLYKTGDLVRYRRDGNIEFLGRLDQQVKIRGFRIELGEVEAVLARHPAIRQVLVLPRADARGDQRLVAYIVPNPQPMPSGYELRRFLKQKLPEYMVPSAFVFIKTLPLTANGKVDRRSLPPPTQTRPDLERAFIKPRTPVEEVVARTWCQVLGLKELSVHDNFFEVGGHSLLATRVINQLRQIFQVELSLRSLFESPTVAGLSQVLIANETKPGLTERIACTVNAVERMTAEAKNPKLKRTHRDIV